MDDKTEKIRRRYDRVSGIYDLIEGHMEKSMLGKWRKEVMDELEGNILEVGVGTGKNIEHYPKNISVTGIDFSSKMLSKAKERAKTLHKDIKLIQMDAQNMDFDDNTFDTIFTTCVFCSVPDPIKGLKEIRRVCKRHGKIVMIEHVRSERKLMGVLMDVFNPIVVGTYGANINRRTIENIRVAGFNNITVTDLFSDIVKKIVVINDK